MSKEPLNSKVIKSFVPELRSRYVFFEFRDSSVLCIYIYEHPMYILHIHVYDYGTQELEDGGTFSVNYI